MSNQIALPRTGPQSSMPVTVLDWRPVRKNSLRGYAKILLGRALMIDDISVNVSHGRAWAALPSKPLVIDGQHAVDAEGKPRWKNILEWTSDSARNRFSDAVVRALLAENPEALMAGPAL